MRPRIKTTLTFKSFEEGNVISHRLCKKYWISKDRRCHTCNLEEWQGEPIPLELDHINGDGSCGNEAIRMDMP